MHCRSHPVANYYQPSAKYIRSTISHIARFWHRLSFFFFFRYVFCPLYGFIDRTTLEMTGNRMRERGTHLQQRVPGWDSNPGPLQQGQILCTWEACSASWTKQHPIVSSSVHFCAFLPAVCQFFLLLLFFFLYVSFKLFSYLSSMFYTCFCKCKSIYLCTNFIIFC